MRGKPLERFMAKVIKHPSGCWEWTGSLTTNGYGWFWDGNKKVRAHRFSYEQAKGIIPIGLELDHLCRNKKCVNPNHLEAITRGENIKRGILPFVMKLKALARTHCPHGHPYNKKNTYIRPEGWKECRACWKGRPSSNPNG